MRHMLIFLCFIALLIINGCASPKYRGLEECICHGGDVGFIFVSEDNIEAQTINIQNAVIDLGPCPGSEVIPNIIFPIEGDFTFEGFRRLEFLKPALNFDDDYEYCIWTCSETELFQSGYPYRITEEFLKVSGANFHQFLITPAGDDNQFYFNGEYYNPSPTGKLDLENWPVYTAEEYVSNPMLDENFCNLDALLRFWLKIDASCAETISDLKVPEFTALDTLQSQDVLYERYKNCAKHPKYSREKLILRIDGYGTSSIYVLELKDIHGKSIYLVGEQSFCP